MDVLWVSQLAEGAPYAGIGVAQWLRDHDAYKWGERRRQYMIRGPSKEVKNPLFQELVEFVCIYPPEAVPTPKFHPSRESPYWPLSPPLSPHLELITVMARNTQGDAMPPVYKEKEKDQEEILEYGTVPVQTTLPRRSTEMKSSESFSSAVARGPRRRKGSRGPVHNVV